MTTVLTDLHHFDLYYSFHKLFEERLGFKLYRPIGTQWSNCGYGFHNNEIGELVHNAYLSTESGQAKKSLKKLENFYASRFHLPQWARYRIELLRIGDIKKEKEGLFFVEDLSKENFWHRCVPYLGLNLKPDILISSVPHHFQAFQEYINCIKRLDISYNPLHLFHMGYGDCEWEIPKQATHLLLHCHPQLFKKDLEEKKFCIYRQEFDLNVFKQMDKEPQKKILCWVHYPESEELMLKVAARLPEWEFKFMAKTLDLNSEVIVKSSELAEEIKSCAFTWHIKPGGESYGHIVHNSLACGVPVIINGNDFKDKPINDLLSTSIDIDFFRRNPAKIASAIQTQYSFRSTNRFQTAQLFEKIVDKFNPDEQKIRKLLNNEI